MTGKDTKTLNCSGFSTNTIIVIKMFQPYCITRKIHKLDVYQSKIVKTVLAQNVGRLIIQFSLWNCIIAARLARGVLRQNAVAHKIMKGGTFAVPREKLGLLFIDHRSCHWQEYNANSKFWVYGHAYYMISSGVPGFIMGTMRMENVYETLGLD